MIAVDGMGGDFAPNAVLRGVIKAAEQGVPIVLTGPEKKLIRYLSDFCEEWESLGITICDAPDVISMIEEPVLAVRKKPKSSLVTAVSLVASGKAQAVVSAGNSGALMAASLFILGRKDGIERPAIAGLLPTLKGRVIVLDLGANVDCKPHYLAQFAQMGVEYAQEILSLPSPRVALLSNGAERGKGSMLVKRASHLLEDSPYNFVGNVEPIDIINHCADVVVCDGFSGNVLLKTMEASAHMVKNIVAHEFSSGGVLRDGEHARIEKALLAIDEKVGEDSHAGARLLGVHGIVLVGHGSANADAIARSIIKAHEIAQARK